MDLSKLPRLSKTESPAPSPDAPPAADAGAAPAQAAPPPATARRGAFCDQCGAQLRAGARFCDSCGTPVAGRGGGAGGYDGGEGGFGFDIWFSLIIGLLFLFLGGWAGGKYYVTRMTGGVVHTGYEWPDGTPKARQEVTVEELQPDLRLGFDQNLMTNTALLLFALSLLADAVVRLLVALRVPGGPVALALGLLLTVAAVGYNLYVTMKLFRAGVTPIWSMLCILIGGYVLFQQWVLVRAAWLASGAKVRTEA